MRGGAKLVPDAVLANSDERASKKRSGERRRGSRLLIWAPLRTQVAVPPLSAKLV